MSDDPTRRRLLRSAALAGSVAAVGPTVAGDDGRSVRLVEAGIRYDVPDGEEYDRVHVDARPQYTVRPRARELVASDPAALETDGSIASGRTTIDGAGEPVRLLPTALTSRKRVRAGVALAEDHRLPEVVLEPDAAETTVDVPSGDRFDLPKGSAREIALPSETVAVRTRAASDERATVRSAPAWHAGRVQEEGAATVEAVPVVAITDHGDLSVVAEDLA